SSMRVMPWEGSGRYSPGPGMVELLEKWFYQELRPLMAICSLNPPGNLAIVSENQSKPAQPKAKTEPPEGSPGNTTKAGESEKATTKPLAAVRGPLALVTSYRYFDDITVFATVDLGAGRIVNLEAAQHLRTALSDEEYEEAKALAREHSEQVKALYQKFGDKLSVNPQFSQFTVKDDPRIHRVIHLT